MSQGSLGQIHPLERDQNFHLSPAAGRPSVITESLVHCGEIPKWCFPESVMSGAGTAEWAMPFSYTTCPRGSRSDSLHTTCRQPGSNNTLTCWAWVYRGLHSQRACPGHSYSYASACSFLSVSMVNLVPEGVQTCLSIVASFGRLASLNLSISQPAEQVAVPRACWQQPSSKVPKLHSESTPRECIWACNNITPGH